MDGAKGPVDAAYLESIARFVRPLKERSYAPMRAAPGQRIADLGCGPASDTLALGALVGPAGRVTGVDNDPAMIAAAEARRAQAGGAANVEHLLADAEALPFPDRSFDACRCERLFQHLGDPAHAMAEMARVTRRGGWIVALDTDWGSAAIGAAETEIERRIARVRAERWLPNGYA
jgi:ubiquinone/menaquinone biosynthesis C-methylase UbiE